VINFGNKFPAKKGNFCMPPQKIEVNILAEAFYSEKETCGNRPVSFAVGKLPLRFCEIFLGRGSPFFGEKDMALVVVLCLLNLILLIFHLTRKHGKEPKNEQGFPYSRKRKRKKTKLAGVGIEAPGQRKR
jgi:hypothetical protein